MAKVWAEDLEVASIVLVAVACIPVVECTSVVDTFE